MDSRVIGHVRAIHTFRSRLPPSDYALWLDPGFTDVERLVPLLRPYPAQEMETFPVEPIVNNPKVDDSRCIAPAKAA